VFLRVLSPSTPDPTLDVVDAVLDLVRDDTRSDSLVEVGAASLITCPQRSDAFPSPLRPTAWEASRSNTDELQPCHNGSLTEQAHAHRGIERMFVEADP
jgi:hypothetical protein